MLIVITFVEFWIKFNWLLHGSLEWFCIILLILKYKQKAEIVVFKLPYCCGESLVDISTVS